MPLTEQYDDAEARARPKVEKPSQEQRGDITDDGLGSRGGQPKQKSRRDREQPAAPDVPKSESADHFRWLDERL